VITDSPAQGQKRRDQKKKVAGRLGFLYIYLAWRQLTKFISLQVRFRLTINSLNAHKIAQFDGHQRVTLDLHWIPERPRGERKEENYIKSKRDETVQEETRREGLVEGGFFYIHFLQVAEKTKRLVYFF